MKSLAPRNPNCKAGDNGGPCGFCEVDWSEPSTLAKRAVPTERCLQALDERAPRRIAETGSYTYCCCNHCFFARKGLRQKEEGAATMLADALAEALPYLRPGVTFGEPSVTRARAEAALRAAGRIP